LSLSQRWKTPPSGLKHRWYWKAIRRPMMRG